MIWYRYLEITAENTFSPALAVWGKFNFSLSGTWAATVYVQRSFDNEVTWVDVEAFTENTEKIGEDAAPGTLYRFGVKAGGYTSGTIIGRIGF